MACPALPGRHVLAMTRRPLTIRRFAFSNGPAVASKRTDANLAARQMSQLQVIDFYGSLFPELAAIAKSPDLCDLGSNEPPSESVDAFVAAGSRHARPVAR